MFEYRDIPDSNIVELTVDGRVTQKDFDDVIDVMNRKIEAYGHVAVLEEIRSIGAIPPSVLWDDLRWVFRHLKHVSRAAVVAEMRWVRTLVDMLQSVVTAEVRHFEPGHI
ncbi:MAG TPA: STAS/SEC14 domain-containing protein, partial [Woeseiaceae bacterium]|nr:STAS/SEC14 domain-containing protein [Woeseiaceae bacterium]